MQCSWIQYSATVCWETHGYQQHKDIRSISKSLSPASHQSGCSSRCQSRLNPNSNVCFPPVKESVFFCLKPETPWNFFQSKFNKAKQFTPQPESFIRVAMGLLQFPSATPTLYFSILPNTRCRVLYLSALCMISSLGPAVFTSTNYKHRDRI